jgi:hypothetical protein
MMATSQISALEEAATQASQQQLPTAREPSYQNWGIVTELNDNEKLTLITILMVNFVAMMSDLKVPKSEAVRKAISTARSFASAYAHPEATLIPNPSTGGGKVFSDEYVKMLEVSWLIDNNNGVGLSVDDAKKVNNVRKNAVKQVMVILTDAFQRSGPPGLKSQLGDMSAEQITAGGEFRGFNLGKGKNGKSEAEYNAEEKKKEAMLLGDADSAYTYGKIGKSSEHHLHPVAQYLQHAAAKRDHATRKAPYLLGDTGNVHNFALGSMSFGDTSSEDNINYNPKITRQDIWGCVEQAYLDALNEINAGAQVKQQAGNLLSKFGAMSGEVVDNVARLTATLHEFYPSAFDPQQLLAHYQQNYEARIQTIVEDPQEDAIKQRIAATASDPAANAAALRELGLLRSRRAATTNWNFRREMRPRSNIVVQPVVQLAMSTLYSDEEMDNLRKMVNAQRARTDMLMANEHPLIRKSAKPEIVQLIKTNAFEMTEADHNPHIPNPKHVKADVSQLGAYAAIGAGHVDDNGTLVEN